jgi:hypothetical protein
MESSTHLVHDVDHAKAIHGEVSSCAEVLRSGGDNRSPSSHSPSLDQKMTICLMAALAGATSASGYLLYENFYLHFAVLPKSREYRHDG